MLTHEQAMQKYVKLMAKLEKFVEARRIAEKAFNELKFGDEHGGPFTTTQDWADVCKASGMHPSCDFGDLTC